MYLDNVPGRDGALRRPRRRAKRQATESSVTDWAPRAIRSALADSGGDIAARCPYQNQERCADAPFEEVIWSAPIETGGLF